MRGGWLAGVCCALVASGCMAWQSPRPSLPQRHRVFLDQLVVHSNFELPSQHRLLQEINAQRVDLSNKLNLPISDEPIHVYLFDDAEQYAAFIGHKFPEFPHRRAFFVETDTRLAVYAHWGDRVAEDLRHEVAHGYLHASVPNLPLWLDEGLAEYFEVPRGTHGLNRPHVDLLLATCQQNPWRPDIRRLEALRQPADMTQLDYAESWLWVHWLLETHPNRRQLLQDYLAQLRRDGIVEPMSLHLRRLGGNPEAAVFDHLRYLASK
jgi:hypothetical protein